MYSAIWYEQLLFGDSLCLVTGNDKDEAKVCQMMFDMD